MNRFSKMAAIAAIGVCSTAQADTLSYAYDSLGRLVGAVADNGPTAKATTIYSYDNSDNRSRVNVVKADGTKVPIFRFLWGTWHFYALNFMDGNGANFEQDGIVFYLLPTGGTGRSAVYRCRDTTNGHWFMSLSTTCEGHDMRGLAGYSSNSAGTGLRQLYRYYKSSTQDTLVTVNTAEATGYTFVSSLGYVI